MIGAWTDPLGSICSYGLLGVEECSYVFLRAMTWVIMGVDMAVASNFHHGSYKARVVMTFCKGVVVEVHRGGCCGWLHMICKRRQLCKA